MMAIRPHLPVGPLNRPRCRALLRGVRAEAPSIFCAASAFASSERAQMLKLCSAVCTAASEEARHDTFRDVERCIRLVEALKAKNGQDPTPPELLQLWLAFTYGGITRNAAGTVYGHCVDVAADVDVRLERLFTSQYVQNLSGSGRTATAADVAKMLAAVLRFRSFFFFSLFFPARFARCCRLLTLRLRGREKSSAPLRNLAPPVPAQCPPKEACAWSARFCCEYACSKSRSADALCDFCLAQNSGTMLARP
jgi:hypothetical protein